MVSLLPYNTLRVPAKAHDFKLLKSLKELKKLRLVGPHLFLGGGANILFVHDFAGTIIHVGLKGKKIISENKDEITIEVAAGENWHDIVMWTVENNWSGLENMALIPGTVGAAVVGNIAAYGQNQGDLVHSVEVFDLLSKKTEILTHDQCEFVYRDSAFKKKYKNKFLVTKVIYKLSKIASSDTAYHSRHESLESELRKLSAPPYTIKNVAQAVINIRKIKMPDWNKIGTAGSFFKNPFVTKEKLTQLQSHIPDLQFYPTEKMLYPRPFDPIFSRTDLVKIPAGRLLDELGWRNKRIGNVGTFEKHALVIVNYGGATGAEIYEFAESMRADVKNNFDIDLEYEVVIVK